MRHDSRTFLPIHSLIASVALCCAGTLPLLAERPATLTNYQFVSVTPCRVVDTRNANGAFGGPAIPGGTSRSFTIPASPTCTGIPSTAAAYSLNVTVVPEGDLGYLTVWPAGETQPVVSTLNSLDGRIKANAAIVPAGTLGAVSVFASNTTNVVLDINGYFESASSSTLEFYPLTPCRVADTRTAEGLLGGPSLVANIERDFPVLSASCGIPSTAQEYSLNFTAIPPGGNPLGYLTVWATGQSKPVVSTLNDLTGTIVANAVIVPAGVAGDIAVFPNNATDLVIDVNGYFAPAGSGGLSLFPMTPCRVLDTRKTNGAFSGKLVVQVESSVCTPPSTAQAYVFNATVVPTGDLGYLTLWPDGETQPGVSTLNAADGAITSNMAIVPNQDGETDAYASGTTQLVLDLSAYFAPGVASTTTALVSSLNPSTSGQAVTFAATVSGGESPSGTVAFTSNGTAISGCSAVMLSSGSAQCTTSTLAVGSDAIMATYSGDPNNAGSSGSLTQVVNGGPTTSTTIVASSQNPSTSGQSVTFTATVTGSGATPTGTVTWSTNTNCSVVTLSSSGTATCTTPLLAVGSDAIVATYSGDTNYLGSSGNLSQIVTNPCPTTDVSRGPRAPGATFSGDSLYSGGSGSLTELIKGGISSPVQFVPVTPCRVVDTCNADGPFGGPAIAGGESRSFTIPTGSCPGIPSTAVAYSLNVTVFPPGPLGNLTLWPTGEGQPSDFLLNAIDGRIKSDAAITAAGTGGAVSVYASNTTNVALDIDGYFSAASSSTLEFYPLTPCRLVDTRGADGPLGGPSLVAATERDFPLLSSVCGIPSSAQAYSLNFTAIPPAPGDVLDYLTVWPQGQVKPSTTTLSNFTGTLVVNAGVVAAGTNGGIAVYPTNATNLAIDVNGYFAAAGTGGLSLYTALQCQVLDTSTANGAFSGELTVNVVGSACAPPSAAQAYVFNATVTPSGDLGYLTLWADGETQSAVSTLNAEDGAITSNMAIVLNVDGKTDAYASSETQLIMDIYGYFAP